jgi:hypothetical protein
MVIIGKLTLYTPRNKKALVSMPGQTALQCISRLELNFKSSSITLPAVFSQTANCIRQTKANRFNRSQNGSPESWM